MTGVDVDFVVDVLNPQVGASVGSQLDAFGSTSSAALVTELKSSGLTAVTDVALSKAAATVYLPPPPSLLPPPPRKLVDDYVSGASSTRTVLNALLLIVAAVFA